MDNFSLQQASKCGDLDDPIAVSSEECLQPSDLCSCLLLSHHVSFQLTICAYFLFVSISSNISN